MFRVMKEVCLPFWTSLYKRYIHSKFLHFDSLLREIVPSKSFYANNKLLQTAAASKKNVYKNKVSHPNVETTFPDAPANKWKIKQFSH